MPNERFFLFLEKKKKENGKELEMNRTPKSLYKFLLTGVHKEINIRID
jgi:hypothetical protein